MQGAKNKRGGWEKRKMRGWGSSSGERFKTIATLVNYPNPLVKVLSN